jgi:predicted membrane protein
MEPHYQHLYDILAHAQGYIFPNEIDLQWGILIVVYPFITGLVSRLKF